MESEAIITELLHNYFNYKAELNRNDLRRMLREGWSSLLIGIAFLIACSMAAHSIESRIVSEGLTIIGWVVMWRPLEIYLYRWWPVRQLGRVYRKLGAADVEVRVANS